MLCLFSAQGRAQQSVDFRIETDVLEPGKAKPIEQSVVLFVGNVAYEYSRQSPQRITIIDQTANRITFLDTQRQVQTRVNLRDMVDEMERAKRDYAQTADGAEKTEDGAIVSFSDQQDAVTVGKRFIRYDAKLQIPTEAAIAQQYADFANVSAIISATKSRGSLPPPFARLNLNEVLRQKLAIPTEISRTVSIGDKKNVLLSRLHLTATLVESERKTVEQFNTLLLHCPTLSLAEYQHPAPALAR
jgi:hypothetical protein